MLAVSSGVGTMGNVVGDGGVGKIYDTGLVVRCKIVAPGEKSCETERD